MRAAQACLTQDPCLGSVREFLLGVCSSPKAIQNEALWEAKAIPGPFPPTPQTPPAHLPPGRPCPPVDDEVPVQVLKATEHLEHDALHLEEVQKHRKESFDTLPSSHQQPQEYGCCYVLHSKTVLQCIYLYMYEHVTHVCIRVGVRACV